MSMDFQHIWSQASVSESEATMSPPELTTIDNYSTHLWLTRESFDTKFCTNWQQQQANETKMNFIQFNKLEDNN